jgi:hypothetical protein
VALLFCVLSPSDEAPLPKPLSALRGVGSWVSKDKNNKKQSEEINECMACVQQTNDRTNEEKQSSLRFPLISFFSFFIRLLRCFRLGSTYFFVFFSLTYTITTTTIAASLSVIPASAASCLALGWRTLSRLGSRTTLPPR